MTHDSKEDDGKSYVVLVNEEEQHSLWPSHKAVPSGWRKAREAGTKSECLRYVDEAWSDITPLSVRKRLAG